MRWAISKYIDRDQIVDFGWAGAASTAALPLPQYPGTQRFYDATQDLLKQYDTLEFNPAKGDAILQSKGFSKDPDGIWVAPDGTRPLLQSIGHRRAADVAVFPRAAHLAAAQRD